MTLFTTDPEVRFQDCTPLTRLWRRRYLLAVPYRAVQNYLSCVFHTLWNRDPSYYETFRVCWKVSHGCAHVQMNWVYSMDEVFDRLKLGLDSED